MKKEALTYFIPIKRKLFEHYLWCEEREYSRFEAWIYLLKEARFEDTKLLDNGKLVSIKRGQVYASIRFLATAFGWSKKRVETFLKLLVRDNMLKIETVKETGQGLITICNYGKYNSVVLNGETAKETPQRQRGDTEETKSNRVNKDNNIPPYIPPSEEAVEKNWRDDFKVYLSQVTQAYENLIDDAEFIREREKYHPNLNIRLSLEKSFVDYWCTEKAWKRRRKSKTEVLNWKSTFKNSLDQKFNHVYRQKESQQTGTTATTGQLHPALQ